MREILFRGKDVDDPSRWVGNTKETSKKPSVVSIFSGCGGLDYGFHMEGYETV